jgi:hypothetical protein
MEDRIDRLFQEWHHVGGAVLVSEANVPLVPRSPEEVIAESMAHCRESGRLMWVVLDWMLRHVEEIDDQKLLEMTQQFGDLSVLGVLADAANQKKPHPKWRRLMQGCRPHRHLTIFFHRVAASPLASRLTRENALALFRRWNYLCSELRYLGEG